MAKIVLGIATPHHPGRSSRTTERAEYRRSGERSQRSALTQVALGEVDSATDGLLLDVIA